MLRSICLSMMNMDILLTTQRYWLANHPTILYVCWLYVFIIFVCLLFCSFLSLFLYQRWRDKPDVLRYLPTKDLCLQSVIYAKLMTDRKTNGLADFNTKFQHDPIALNSSELYVFRFLQYRQSSSFFSVVTRD